MCTILSNLCVYQFLLCVFMPMSENSPCSPLSLNSSSNGSGSNMQGQLSPSHYLAQSSNPSLLDGLRLNHTDQPCKPTRPTFSDTLKFGVGGHGCGIQPAVESKSSLQSGTNEPTRILPLGESSAPVPQVPLHDPVRSQSDPNPSIGEFLACYLLGKVGGGCHSFTRHYA